MDTVTHPENNSLNSQELLLLVSRGDEAAFTIAKELY